MKKILAKDFKDHKKGDSCPDELVVEAFAAGALEETEPEVSRKPKAKSKDK